MKPQRTGWRRWKSRLMAVLAVLCVVAALIPLFAILGAALARGLPAVLSPGFFTTNLPVPCSPGTLPADCPKGGIFNSLQGTIVLIGVGSLIAIPVGILTGIYLSEYGGSRASGSLRFFVEVMVGIPSIVVGIFVYTAITLAAMNGWISSFWATSTFAGALALAVIMIPIIARTCDEALAIVPRATREAALALGIPRHRTTLHIVLATGRGAVLTGVLLGVARGIGETAPLIVTAGTLSIFGFQGLAHPTANLPYTIYQFGLSNYSNWIPIAWGGAIVLIGVMLLISIGARLLFYRAARRMGGGLV